MGHCRMNLYILYPLLYLGYIGIVLFLRYFVNIQEGAIKAILVALQTAICRQLLLILLESPFNVVT